MGSFCTVTGQVVDPSGNPYINANLVCVFIPAPTAIYEPTLGYRQPFPTVVAQADCDATGRFVRVLANNTLVNDGHAGGQTGSQWCFRFTTALGYVPQIGFSWCGVISGDMDISAELAAVAPPIIPPGGGGGGGGITPPPTVPTITSLSPSMGPVGTVVTISGSDFEATQGLSTVTFNGIPATVTRWGITGIVVTVPAGASTGNVVVTTPDGPSNGMPFTVTSGPAVPVLTGINPVSGTVSTSVNVTLSGTGLLGTTAVNSTDGITVSNVTVVSDTTVTATFTLPSTATTTSITLVTPGGTSNALTFSVTTVAPPPAPVLTGISPSSGPGGLNVNVTLSGHALTGTTAVNASNLVTVSNVVVVSDTTVTATFGLPTPAGGTVTSNITVTTPAGTSNALAFSVTTTTVVPPTGGTTFMLESITGGVTIPGGVYNGQPGISLFCDTAWSPSITLAVGGSAYVTGTGSYDGYFTVAGISPGPDNFGMTLVAGSNMNTNVILEQGSIILGFTGGAGPTLTTVTPSSAAANSAAVITMGGTGFTGASAVNYSGTGITHNALAVASNTSLSTTFGISLSATSGNVTVTAPSGTSNGAAFSVTAWVPPAAPLLNSVSPTSGSAGTAVPITLNGSGFTGNPAIAPTAVNYSGTGGTIGSVVVVGDNQITATLTLATGATSGVLTVTTPSGTSNGAKFIVSGSAAPATPAGYPAFIFGGTALGIYVAVQTPMPSTLAVGNTVTIAGTGSYDGTFTVAQISSPTDLFLNPGTNSATVIVSKQGLIYYP